MGGAIAQLLALDYPSKVDSLTLISTTAGAGDADLPSSSPELTAYFDLAPDPDVRSRRGGGIHRRGMPAYAATSVPFDDEAIRRVAAHAIARTSNVVSSQQNHALAAGGEPWRARLAEITVPTVILHGTEDPLFPFDHGAALAAEIPGAQLVPSTAWTRDSATSIWELAIPRSSHHLRTGPSGRSVGRPVAGRWRRDRLVRAVCIRGLGGAVDMPWDRTDPNQLLGSGRARGPAGRDDKRAWWRLRAGRRRRYVATLGSHHRLRLSGPPSRWPGTFVSPARLPAANLPSVAGRVAAGVRPGGGDLHRSGTPAEPAQGRHCRAGGPGGRWRHADRHPGGPPDLAEPSDGPPWPLHRSEIDRFESEGLRPVNVELVEAEWSHLGGHWRAEFTRPSRPEVQPDRDGIQPTLISNGTSCSCAVSEPCCPISEHLRPCGSGIDQRERARRRRPARRRSGRAPDPRPGRTSRRRSPRPWCAPRPGRRRRRQALGQPRHVVRRPARSRPARTGPRRRAP